MNVEGQKRKRKKPTIDDVLDDVAERQRALGIVVDEQEIADDADRTVAEIRKEDVERSKLNRT